MTTNPLELAASTCLFLTLAFAVLCFITPPGHRYETVDGVRVSTRKVLGLLGVLSLLAWLTLQLGF